MTNLSKNEELEYVKNNYFKMSIIDMSKELNRSHKYVEKLLNLLNINKRDDMKKYWNEYILKNYLLMTNEEIAQELNLNVQYIYKLKRELNITYHHKKEKLVKINNIKKYILENYDNMTDDEMSINLNCSINTIKKYRIELKLKCRNPKKNNYNPNPKGTVKEKTVKIIEFIKNNIDKMNDEEIGKVFNISSGQIEKIRLKNKLYRRKSITPYKYLTELYENEEFINMTKIGFSNYSVSNYGRIKNDNTNQLLHLRHNHDNYLSTDLINNNGKHVGKLAHVFVAKMFIENIDPEHKTEVNHKNGVKDDNRVENLEWVTPEENKKHAIDNGLIKSNKGENNPATNHTNDEIRNICIALQQNKSVKEILILYPSFTKDIISQIKSRRTWKDISKDYIF